MYFAWQFQRFSRKVADYAYVSMVSWCFCDHFPWARRKRSRNLHNTNRFQVLFERNFPSSPHVKHQLKHNEHFMVLTNEFTWIPFPNPYENLHEKECHRPIWDRNAGRVPQHTKKISAKQSILGPPFFTFPGIHENLLNCICFWHFWSSFSWIPCHTSKTIDSDRTGRRGFDTIFVTFPRP